MAKTYDELNIYDASFDEVYQAVRMQYKNREHEDYQGRKMTLGDFAEINKNICADLKEMGVRFRTAFYNPNNMRVYIKQSFRKSVIKCDDGEIIELTLSSSDDYCSAVGSDLYYDDESEYITVPAW